MKLWEDSSNNSESEVNEAWRNSLSINAKLIDGIITWPWIRWSPIMTFKYSSLSVGKLLKIKAVYLSWLNTIGSSN